MIKRCIRDQNWLWIPQALEGNTTRWVIKYTTKQQSKFVDMIHYCYWKTHCRTETSSAASTSHQGQQCKHDQRNYLGSWGSSFGYRQTFLLPPAFPHCRVVVRCHYYPVLATFSGCDWFSDVIPSLTLQWFIVDTAGLVGQQGQWVQRSSPTFIQWKGKEMWIQEWEDKWLSKGSCGSTSRPVRSGRMREVCRGQRSTRPCIWRQMETE